MEEWICSCGQKRIPSSSNDIDKKINPPTDSTPTTQPLKQNPPQLSEYPTQTDNNKRNYVIIGLLVVIMGLIGAITYLMLKEKPEEVVINNPPAKSANERRDERVTEPSVSAPVPEVKKYFRFISRQHQHRLFQGTNLQSYRSRKSNHRS